VRRSREFDCEMSLSGLGVHTEPLCDLEEGYGRGFSVGFPSGIGVDFHFGFGVGFLLGFGLCFGFGYRIGFRFVLGVGFKIGRFGLWGGLQNWSKNWLWVLTLGWGGLQTWHLVPAVRWASTL